VIKKETFTNPDFEVSAWTAEGEIMGVRHKSWELHGVQFHPESFLSIEGPKLLQNFLNINASN
jgi:anthranilate/para-aminobenzoate synthase component II